MAAGAWEAWSKNPPLDVAPWLGGKRNLAKCICAIVDADRAHTTYAEPFVGRGGIFLRRAARPPASTPAVRAQRHHRTAPRGSRGEN